MMKLVREHINEKFSSESDPIQDLGIGIYKKRTFKNVGEAIDFVIKVMPAIINTRKIPEDIISVTKEYHLPKKYWDPLYKYVFEYISVVGETSKFSVSNEILQRMVNVLKEKGFTNLNKKIIPPYNG